MNATEPTCTRQHGTKNTNTHNDPAAKLAAVRAIVAEKQYAKIDGTMIDLYSASALVAVHDALSEENRARLLALPIAKACAIAFKLLK